MLLLFVIATGQTLYEKDRRTRVEFEARALGLYYDQLPILREDYDAGVEWYRTALRATDRMLAQTRVAQDK